MYSMQSASRMSGELDRRELASRWLMPDGDETVKANFDALQLGPPVNPLGDGEVETGRLSSRSCMDPAEICKQ